MITFSGAKLLNFNLIFTMLKKNFLSRYRTSLLQKRRLSSFLIFTQYKNLSLNPKNFSLKYKLM